VRSMPEIDIDHADAEQWSGISTDLSKTYDLTWRPPSGHSDPRSGSLLRVFDFFTNYNSAGAEGAKEGLMANISGRDSNGRTYHFLLALRPLGAFRALRALFQGQIEGGFLGTDLTPLAPLDDGYPALKAKGSEHVQPLTEIDFVKLVVKFSILDHPALPK
jgi:hypothetical protein